MAKSNGNAKPTPSVQVVAPPPMQRGGANRRYPEGFLVELTAQIQGRDDNGGPVFVGDGLTYVAESGSEEAKGKAHQRASTAAMRLRKALVNSPETPYADTSEIKSRVWESEPGTYVLAVYERAAVTTTSAPGPAE